MNVIDFFKKLNDDCFEIHLGVQNRIWLEDIRNEVTVCCDDWTEYDKQFSVFYKAYTADAYADDVIELMKIMEEFIELLEKEKEEEKD